MLVMSNEGYGEMYVYLNKAVFLAVYTKLCSGP